MASDEVLTARVGAPRGAGRALEICDLGLIDYKSCWELQNRRAREVGQGLAFDTLLLLQHPHTLTCGRKGGRDHILVPQSVLLDRGIEVLDVDRGGDVTYHGPGQLVAYPIVRLAESGDPIDYSSYVRALEDVLIETLSDFGIHGERVTGFSGVWVRTGRDYEKVAAVGVRVDGLGVSTHGIALNVTTDLSFFNYIVPCGIAGKGVTSLGMLLEHTPAFDEVQKWFVRHFCEQFGFVFNPGPPRRSVMGSHSL